MSSQNQLMVAVDSQTLVWGIRKLGNPEQMKRARWLFEMLNRENAQIIIPAVAASEYLTPLEPSNHRAVLASLSKRFLIMPFDVNCAARAAELFTLGNKTRKRGRPGGRNCLRADSLIIATAKEKGASVFYSGDKGCRNLASKIMTAKDLPQMSDTLFEL